MREYKGQSITKLPKDYVVIDIETTGLDPKHDSIIEIAGIKYENYQQVDTFEELINPGHRIGCFITELTGITNEMLSAADTIENILPKFINFIGTNTLVAHNANFDINFIYDNLLNIDGTYCSNDFVDTLKVSRRTYTELKKHKMKSLCKHFNIVNENSHRALSDCRACNEIYLHLVDDYNDEQWTIDHKRIKYKLNAIDITSKNTEFDTSNPIYNNVFVFTGILQNMVRKEAMQIVVDLGGMNGNSVTKSTNYLVLGNNDYVASIKDGKSSKQKKAEKLKLEGQDIEIISESVFYDLVNCN